MPMTDHMSINNTPFNMHLPQHAEVKHNAGTNKKFQG